MPRRSLAALAASLLLAAPALAQPLDVQGTYHLDGRSVWGNQRLSATLEVAPQADGSLQVAHRLEPDGPTLRGTGSLQSGALFVRFDQVEGAANRLAAIHLFGNGRTPTSFLARYEPSDGGAKLAGWLLLRDANGRYTYWREAGERPAAPAVDLSQGALAIPDRATFEALSRRDNVPGAMGVREVKFLVTGVDGPNPVLHFINSVRYPYHYEFARGALGVTLSLGQFNARTYFTDDRSFIAGSLIAHDGYEHPDLSGRGIYTVEFWPTDPVKVRHVEVAYRRVLAGMPFAAERIYYHPNGETQRGLYAQERDEFRARDIRVIATEDLFGNLSYSPLNLGEGVGILRVMDGASGRPPTVRDVVIFTSLPNDLSHVAGVITEAPQTPLSHINLKAKQNDTPNAFIKDASRLPQVAALVGQPVRYRVTPDGWSIEAATADEVERALEALRPKDPQVPPRDLSVTTVQPLDDIGHGAISSVGAKAANLAELRKILPAGVVPDGFAIPFAFYDRFMQANDLYAAARRMMADPDFQRDPAAREEALRRFRRDLRRAPVPADIHDALGALQARFPAGSPIRARSSTNNEDLEGFNGAGLYDSYTHRPDEGHLEETVKQVWASLWNYRAFEEREFYKIDHERTAMGVLVHPNFDDERANGVAVTKNIYDPNWPGFYINVQVGESLVTNPDPGATPDELLVAALGPNGEYETQFVRHSTLLPAGQATVLTAAQVQTLVRHMERIQAHFKQVYGKQNDPSFAMDIEFKLNTQGRIQIKQARPWVD